MWHHFGTLTVPLSVLLAVFAMTSSFGNCPELRPPSLVLHLRRSGWSDPEPGLPQLYAVVT